MSSSGRVASIAQPSPDMHNTRRVPGCTVNCKASPPITTCTYCAQMLFSTARMVVRPVSRATASSKGKRPLPLSMLSSTQSPRRASSGVAK